MILSRLPNPIATELHNGLKAHVALKHAAAWSENRAHRFLVLEGNPGSGKTMAAAWAFEFARDRVRHRGPIIGSVNPIDPWPVWCDARLVCSMVGHEWRAEKQWTDFDNARVVVIDDVGLEREADRMADLLERLYNVSSGRAILTTNLGFEQFSERYGQRVQSRIVGASQWVTIADPDMRMQAPEGEPFAAPQDETASELVARLKAEEEHKREEAAWEAGKVEREKFWADQMQLIKNLGEEHTWRPSPPVSNASDEERRDLLRRQVEQLQDREGA